jgi:hypothetical protein
VISNLLHFTLGVWIINHHAKFGNLLRNPMVVVDDRRLRVRAYASDAAGSGSTVAIKLVGDALISDDAAVARRAARGRPLGCSAARDRGRIACPVTGADGAAAGARAGLDATQRGLLILFGALPPAVLNFMVAEAFRQEPHKVASIVLIGNDCCRWSFVPLGLDAATCSEYEPPRASTRSCSTSAAC